MIPCYPVHVCVWSHRFVYVHMYICQEKKNNLFIMFATRKSPAKCLIFSPRLIPCMCVCVCVCVHVCTYNVTHMYTFTIQSFSSPPTPLPPHLYAFVVVTDMGLTGKCSTLH